MSINQESGRGFLKNQLLVSQRNTLKFFIRIFLYKIKRYVTGVFTFAQLTDFAILEKAPLRKSQWNLADLRLFVKKVCFFFTSKGYKDLFLIFEKIR